MILKWAAYLMLLVFAAYEAVVFSNIIVSMLLVSILLWPLVIMTLLMIQRRRLKIEMKIPVPVAEKDGHIQIQIIAEQNGRMPAARLEAPMTSRLFFDDSKEIYPLTLNVDGGHSCQYIYHLSQNSCGKLHLEIKSIRLWDYFHFFSLKKKADLSQEITFLPKIYETAVTVCEATRHFAGETEDYEPEAAGPDYSQIYQVREYRPGDRLQMIHWKLTARNDELYVRESSEPVCFAVGIFMDLSEKGKNSPQWMESLIETVLSISNSLLEEKCRHFIVWYDKKDDRLIKRKIGKTEDIYEVTEYLMTASVYQEPADLIAMYRERYPYGLYAAAIQIDLEGNIRKEEEIIGRYDRNRLEQSLGELLIQV